MIEDGGFLFTNWQWKLCHRKKLFECECVLEFVRINYTTRAIRRKRIDKYNFSKSSKEDNDSTSRHIFYSQHKASYSPFNKGLIHLLSKAMQKGKENNPSILKTQNKTD